MTSFIPPITPMMGAWIRLRRGAAKNKEGKYGFCWNSRRWLSGGRIPNCPKDSGVDCDHCDYYELRYPTAYLERKLNGKTDSNG